MEVILAMIIAYSGPQAVPAKALAAEITKVARLYNVDPVLLTRIAMTESKGMPTAYNRTSKDHGLMQINHKTAQHLNISRACLYNWKCNLAAAAKLISEQSKHAGWRPCMYNTGRIGAKRYPKSCLQYEAKLASIY